MIKSAGPSNRSGAYVRQPSGYRAFIPRPLPPDPPLDYDADLMERFEDAVEAVGRLDGVSDSVPNPDLFVAMYVRKEAVLSSQIEGTQSSLEDILEYEVGVERDALPRDVHEVYNYVRALNHGLERLSKLPLSLRLIREIHAILMENVRGASRAPGEFRRSQNWIGPEGASLQEAYFVPPPPHEMQQALHDLEAYLRDGKPDLVACGLVHSQFETIHPFLDGNGRLGRLLITFMLCERGVLRRPLLYLSHFLRRNRERYYDRLTAVREEGDWEGWLSFFLTGVAEVSAQATGTARRIADLRERHREILAGMRGTRRHALHDLLFHFPFVSGRFVESRLGISYGTANSLLSRFEKAGILEEFTGKQRYRLFRYRDYVDLFAEPGS